MALNEGVAAAPMKSLKQCMKALFDSKNGSDVTFVVDGKELKAHQLIVGNRSPVLQAMIKGPFGPPDLRHHFEDPEVAYEDFENFLCFLYTDFCDFGESKIKALLHLGSIYDVPLLIQRCVEKIEVQLKNNDGYYNAIFRYAEMGLKYAPNSSLVQICLQRLSLLESNDFSLSYQTVEDKIKWISPGMVMEFVKQFPRNDKITEDDVFQQVLEWAIYQCFDCPEDFTVENFRAIILSFMPHFDPSKFMPLTVAKTVKTFKLLPDEDLIQCLAGHIVKLVGNENSSRLPRNDVGYVGHGGNGNRPNPAPRHRGPPAKSNNDGAPSPGNGDTSPAARADFEFIEHNVVPLVEDGFLMIDI